MRESHPMRYNRMTEILKVVASVKLSKTFLLKSYFLKVSLNNELQKIQTEKDLFEFRKKVNQTYVTLKFW